MNGEEEREKKMDLDQDDDQPLKEKAGSRDRNKDKKHVRQARNHKDQQKQTHRQHVILTVLDWLEHRSIDFLVYRSFVQFEPASLRVGAKHWK